MRDRLTRPCFLVLEQEFPSNLSTRKLVIETAKFNVLSAYSPEEAVRTLGRFPNVDGIVMDANRKDVPCAQLIEHLRAVRGDVPIITVAPGGFQYCEGQTEHVDSMNPAELVAKLQELFPKATEAIEQREETLADRYNPA